MELPVFLLSFFSCLSVVDRHIAVNQPMVSQKTKMILLVSAGVLFVIVMFGGIAFFIFKVRAETARARALADLKESNPVEYHILHTPLARNDNDLRNTLVGTWRLVGARSFSSGEFVRLSEPDNFHKTFTLTNWAIATYDAQSNLVSSASGRYTLQGEFYTEYIDDATGMMTKYLGRHPKFRIRVDGDDYYQMGAGKNPMIEEMWHRTGS